jgi:hypothetical protein
VLACPVGPESSCGRAEGGERAFGVYAAASVEHLAFTRRTPLHLNLACNRVDVAEQYDGPCSSSLAQLSDRVADFVDGAAFEAVVAEPLHEELARVRFRA